MSSAMSEYLGNSAPNVRVERRRCLADGVALYAERRPLERVVRPRFTTFLSSLLICV